METKELNVPSARACAEAAAWIARLHGEARTLKVEAGFQRWLATDPNHREAFEMANELWEGAERWPKPAKPPSMWLVGTGFWVLPRLALAAGIAMLMVAGAALYLNLDPKIATDIGEQRNLTLEDGTRVSLNTATRIRLDYGPDVRRVRLEAGEALFEVARWPDRPFIVMAGDRQITALGTAFLVRRDERQIAVTLVEGKVAVESMVVQEEQPSLQREVLEPGERLVFTKAAPPKLDRPALEKVTAWKRNQVILDHTPLSEAVEEMNRYNPIPLTIQHPAALDVQVTGVFQAGDSASFAHAVAAAYRLEVLESAQQIVIAGVPELPSR